MGGMVKHWGGWLAVGVLAAWALSLLWWLLLEPAQARSNQSELVIPEGTAAAIARGEPAPFIPNSLELDRDRELVVINEDVAPHRVASWTIPPGGRATISSTDEEGQFTCTIHPGGVLGYSIDERPPILTTAWASLLLGLPVGLVFGFATFVGSRLGVGPEEETVEKSHSATHS
jgi:hypothetical protein